MAKQELDQQSLNRIVADFDIALTGAQARHAVGNLQNALAFTRDAHEGQAANVADTATGKSPSRGG